jgi:Zn-dependent M28 family amino/carboxypeptidase
MLRPDLLRIKNYLNTLVGERNPHSSPDSLKCCADYIADQFQHSQLIVREEQVPFEAGASDNILGYKKGTTHDLNPFVLAAHYDTVEGSPGADDNASAVAALLETAHCLQSVPLKTPLVFAAFTLEEYGFIGSHHHIVETKKLGNGFSGMISLEMVGYRDSRPGAQSYPVYVDPTRYPETGDFIAVVGNEPSAKLTYLVTEGMRDAEPTLPIEQLIVPGRGDEFTEVRLSDHSPFWEHDIPAVMLTDTAFFRNPNYHQASDTLDTLDLEFIRDTTAAVTGFLKCHLT